MNKEKRQKLILHKFKIASKYTLDIPSIIRLKLWAESFQYFFDDRSPSRYKQRFFI